MQSSLDITQHPTVMNELRKSETLKFASEQSIPQDQCQVQESGASHGIDHHELYVQLSHTGLVNLHNMLSTSLGYLWPLMCIFMITLSFLIRLFVDMLVLTETWSLLTLTSSSTLDPPTWIQLGLQLSNVHRLLPQANPLELLTRRFLNPATTGMRGCAHLIALSVADFMFAANAFSLGTKVLTAHQNSDTPLCLSHLDLLFCHHIFQPP